MSDNALNRRYTVSKNSGPGERVLYLHVDDFS